MASGPGIYLAAGLTVLLSLLLGAALCARDERGWTWLAPGCGFAAVLGIGWLAVRLPGNGVTAGVILLLAAIASAVRLRGRVEWPRLWVGVPTAALVLAATSLPFLANRRFGALGATINDDLALHFEFADILRLGPDAAKSVDIAYPVGPHSLVAALSDSLGLSIESAFLGVIIAIPVLTALTALAALEHVPARVRPVGAVLVGLGYISAAFYAQASFKETVMASLVLTFVLVLREVTTWRRSFPLLAVIVIAGLAAFSIPALFWFVGIGVAVTAVTMIVERRRPDRAFVLGALGLLVLLVGTVAVFEALTSFFRLGPGRFVLTASDGSRGGGAGSGGNLVQPLSFFEALGVWPSADFRLDPQQNWWELGAALAVLAAVVGISLSAIRREWVLVTGTVVATVTFFLVDEVSLDYNAAKALVIAAPLLALCTMAGLLMRVQRPLPALLLATLAAVFTVAAAHSAVQPLKGGLVRPDSQAEAFAQVRRAVAGRPTIFLGRNNYSAWELRSTRTGYLGIGARAANMGFRPPPGVVRNKDLDSLALEELNAADLLVAPNTLYASLPGPEFREVLRNRWFVVYRRTAPSPQRFVLAEKDEPGATLDCSTPFGRAAIHTPGRAFIRPKPIIGPVDGWTFPGGGQPPPGTTVALASNRERIHQTLRLPPGRWEISLSWASSIPIDASIGGRRLVIPPFIGDGPQHWRVASVRGGRRVRIALLPGPERRFDVPRGVQIGTVVAVREDVPVRPVPVARACGRYVDWFER